jgi:AcrR family transcriptional regulator
MRGFSDDERARIRDGLIETGREQFLKYGPERTRVKDITDPVGIAKPTFYQFFDSKGELHLEVISRETEEFVELLQEEIETTDDVRQGVERLFTSYLQFIEQNPNLHKLTSGNHPRELFRNVPQERIDEVQQQWTASCIPIIERLQERSEGTFASHDPGMVLALLRPVGLLHQYGKSGTTRSEEEITEIQQIHIDTLVRGLTCNSE